jgi:hypothetical protein
MGGLAVPPVGLSFCLDPIRGTPSRKNPVEDLLNDLRGGLNLVRLSDERLPPETDGVRCIWDVAKLCGAQKRP